MTLETISNLKNGSHSNKERNCSKFQLKKEKFEIFKNISVRFNEEYSNNENKDKNDNIDAPRLEITFNTKNVNGQQIVKHTMTPNYLNGIKKYLNEKVYFGGNKDNFPTKKIIEIDDEKIKEPQFDIVFNNGIFYNLSYRKIIKNY